MGGSYEHFSRGDRVRIGRAWRTPVTVSGPDAFKEWVDHEAGLEGVVTGMTNAGFRGLEYSVRADNGFTAHGIGAGDLELIEAVDPIVPWPRQGTYRNGYRVGA